MALAAEVAEVRANTGLSDDSLYTSIEIDEIIDAKGSVAAASAAVWDHKAAIYAELVDQSEAGASHKWSDLHKNALQMAQVWHDRAGSSGGGSPRVSKIVRT